MLWMSWKSVCELLWGEEHLHLPSQSRPAGAVTELSGWFTSQRREPWRLPQASSSRPDQSRDVRPPHSSQHPTTYTQLECTDRVSVPTCPLPCVHQLSWFAGLLPWSGGTHLARGNPRRTFTRATFTEKKKKWLILDNLTREIPKMLEFPRDISKL
jgi:hypothetical protein